MPDFCAWSQQEGSLIRNFFSNSTQKFVVIDDRLIWYGSVNLLSFGSAEESVMRLGSREIAAELSSLVS